MISDNLNQVFSDTNPFSVSTWVYGDGGGDGVWHQRIGKGFTPNGGGNPKRARLSTVRMYNG